MPMTKLDAYKKDDILHDFIVKTCVAQARKFYIGDMDDKFFVHKLESFISNLKYSHQIGDFNVEYGKPIRHITKYDNKLVEVWYKQEFSDNVRYFYFDPSTEDSLNVFDREWMTKRLKDGKYELD